MTLQQHLKIEEPCIAQDGYICRLSAHISTGQEAHEVWYATRALGLMPTISPFVVSSLLVAMKLGLALHTDRPVSARLVSNLDTVQDIFRNWDRRLQKVPLELPASPEPSPTGRKVAVFFSGGLDSFYTLLKRRGEIDSLVFIHGFDIPLENVALREQVAAQVRLVAVALKVSLVEIETNVRPFMLRWLAGSWGKLAYGSALASVGLALSSHFRKIYIPAGHTYAHLHPRGTHPLLDPLWSTEAVEFVFDGAEATRVEKAALVAQSDIAMQTLRVCLQNPGGAYNCGRCEKCLRTMINLRAVGALERCKTFDIKLDVRLVNSLLVNPDDIGVLAYIEENLEGLEARGIEPDLQRVLRRLLKRRNKLENLILRTKLLFGHKPIV